MEDRKKSEKNNDKKPAQNNPTSKRKHSRLIYAAGGAFCLALLVACAFFLPSLLFGLKDRYLWRDTVLEARESVDVTLLSASYETSLYNRMVHFAEGLAAGTEYYVSEQDLEVNEELYELLRGGSLYQEPLMILIQGQFLSGGYFDIYTFNNFIVENWKQYVIYSDNYAQGVNFIIWYLEVAADTGEKLEILMDAETMTLYGIKSERDVLLDQEQLEKGWARDRNFNLYEYCNRSFYELSDLWNIFSYYYEALSEEELLKYYEERERKNYVYYDEDLHKTVNEYEINAQNIMNSRIQISSDGNEIVMQISYREHNLDFIMKNEPDPSGDIYFYPQLTIGIEAICRLIPEFSESF